MKIMVVVPAYNEEKRIRKVLKKLKSKKLPVVVVDDGSLDRTFIEASGYGMTVLRHKVNLGKGAALRTGCKYAFSKGADAVILMDSDGQHLVEDVDKFIHALKLKRYDVIFGTRNYELGVPLVRYLGNKMASLLIKAMFGIYVSDLICGYRALTRRGFKKISWTSSGYGVETEMVVRSGQEELPVTEVDVATLYLDKYKGVTILDALGILVNVIKWRLGK